MQTNKTFTGARSSFKHKLLYADCTSSGCTNMSTHLKTLFRNLYLFLILITSYHLTLHIGCEQTEKIGNYT